MNFSVLSSQNSSPPSLPIPPSPLRERGKNSPRGGMPVAPALNYYTRDFPLLPVDYFVIADSSINLYFGVPRKNVTAETDVAERQTRNERRCRCWCIQLSMQTVLLSLKKHPRLCHDLFPLSDRKITKIPSIGRFRRTPMSVLHSAGNRSFYSFFSRETPILVQRGRFSCVFFFFFR